MRFAVAVLAAAVGSLWAAAPAASQQWSLEARAGRMDFELATTVPAATSLGLSLSRESRDGWLQLSSAVPMGEEDPLWGAVSLGRRTVLLEGRAFTIAVDAASQGFLQRYPRQLQDGGGVPFERPLDGGTTWGYGLSTQAFPVAELRLGRVSVRGRTGISWYRSGLDDQSRQRTVSMGDVRLALRPTSGVSFSGDARHYIAPEGDFTFVGITAILARPELTLWGSTGQWLNDAASITPWSAGVDLPLFRRLSLTLEARQEALDPLYGSAPRRAWSAGLRLALSDPPTAAEPVPAEYDDGRATISVPADEVRGEPRIAGDFTDWQPRPMTRVGDEWRFTAALEPGVYEYAFVAPDGTWFVPESVPGRKDDGMGGEVAQLVVERGES